MKYVYKTKGTCSTLIELELEGNIVHNVKFTGGCNGNLQAIPKLVEGLTVEQVSVQNISYAKSITDAYADSQAAEVEKAKAQNQQETAKIKGETKVIEATKEAEANRVLNESLTDNVLTQEYIDTLKEMSKNGNTVVVPQGSTPVVNTK